jgi:uncharacterized protein YheU (UPF0270 family)
MPSNEEKEEYLEIPAEKLAAEVLEAIMEEFILREGTDYGHSELSLDDKKKKLKRQIDTGRAKIVYSTLTENTTLMLAQDVAKL